MAGDTAPITAKRGVRNIPIQIAVVDDAATTDDLPIPDGMILVTATSSANGILGGYRGQKIRKVPVADISRWRRYPEEAEVITFHEYCVREVLRLRAAGREAFIVDTIRGGIKLCAVAASEVQRDA